MDLNLTAIVPGSGKPNARRGEMRMCARWLLRACLYAVAPAVIIAIPAFAQEVGKYSGPGSCAASNCHGSVTPRTTTSVRQTEYSIWASQDRHGRAYTVLSN